MYLFSNCLCLQDGFSPLYIAAQEGHNEVVAGLLGAGANVNIATKVRVGWIIVHFGVVCAVL